LLAAGVIAVFANYGVTVRTNSAGRVFLLAVDNGRITLNDPGLQGMPRRFFPLAERRTMAWGWWFEVRRPRVGTYFAVPLWFPVLAAGAWTAFAHRKRRRPDECSVCGYERAGLASGSPCPECGHL